MSKRFVVVPDAVWSDLRAKGVALVAHPFRKNGLVLADKDGNGEFTDSERKLIADYGCEEEYVDEEDVRDQQWMVDNKWRKLEEDQI